MRVNIYMKNKEKYKFFKINQLKFNRNLTEIYLTAFVYNILLDYHTDTDP